MSDITTLDSLLAVAAATTKTWGTYPWWRGHASSDWGLVPGAHREGRNHSTERNMAVLFMAKAHTRHPECPPEDDVAGWLTLMQHYHLPTRLLDWTESPLVALYFAICDEPDLDGALWTLNPYRLNDAIAGRRSLFGSGTPEARPLLKAAFAREAATQNTVLALTPWETDLRMLLQSSAFTVHDSSTPLETMDAAGEFLLKFRVPSAAKRSLLQHLNVLNIRRSTLFPDLDTLAAEIAGHDFEEKST